MFAKDQIASGDHQLQLRTEVFQPLLLFVLPPPHHLKVRVKTYFCGDDDEIVGRFQQMTYDVGLDPDLGPCDAPFLSVFFAFPRHCPNHFCFCLRGASFDCHLDLYHLHIYYAHAVMHDFLSYYIAHRLLFAASEATRILAYESQCNDGRRNTKFYQAQPGL